MKHIRTVSMPKALRGTQSPASSTNPAVAQGLLGQVFAFVLQLVEIKGKQAAS